MSIFDLFKKIEKPLPPAGGGIEKIIVGLGNPGDKYRNTRHNIGFVFLDAFAAKHNISVKKLKFRAVCGEGVVAGRRILLLKPQTFMNNSGESVREALAFYKLDSSALIAVFDDVSMVPGKVRYRAQGSSGAHNGVKSLIYHLQTDVFDRVKIGVGDRPDRRQDLATWVLGDFPAADLPVMREAVVDAMDRVDAILSGNAQEDEGN